MKGSEAEKNLAKTESWVRVARLGDVSNELFKQFHDEKRHPMESMVYQTVRRHCWFPYQFHWWIENVRDCSECSIKKDAQTLKTNKADLKPIHRPKDV